MKLKMIISETKLSVGKCPEATKNSKVNAKNKQHAIEEYEYGKSQVKGELCENCKAWNTKIVEKCLDDGEGLGFCEMHDFMCQGKKWCNTWAGQKKTKD